MGRSQGLLPPKTAVASGSNVTHSQIPRNLFPFHKLKGNHTFTTQAATVGNDKGEADSSAKQEGKGEMEPSADKEVKVSDGEGGTYQPMEYIVSFTKAVKLYQQKNRSWFGCGSPNHIMWDCLKDISKSAWKVDLNTKEGTAKKGGQTPQKNIPGRHSLSIKTLQKTPFLNPHPLTHWSGPRKHSPG